MSSVALTCKCAFLRVLPRERSTNLGLIRWDRIVAISGYSTNARTRRFKARSTTIATSHRCHSDTSCPYTTSAATQDPAPCRKRTPQEGQVYHQSTPITWLFSSDLSPRRSLLDRRWTLIKTRLSKLSPSTRKISPVTGRRPTGRSAGIPASGCPGYSSATSTGQQPVALSCQTGLFVVRNARARQGSGCPKGEHIVCTRCRFGNRWQRTSLT
ncbi:hypothetical protein C8Q80DRAFT_1122006 [Daedaleopsis nitida]|nr:hypothetical protein C8Q80DRAFT_1122006 [Daedaleopsis nitida]